MIKGLIMIIIVFAALSFFYPSQMDAITSNANEIKTDIWNKTQNYLEERKAEERRKQEFADLMIKYNISHNDTKKIIGTFNESKGSGEKLFEFVVDKTLIGD